MSDPNQNKMKSATDVVSVLMPTKNGIAYIEEVLRAIFAQKTTFPFEVILVDSGSSDGTLEVILKYPVHLIRIEPQTFNHGGTRNLLAHSAKGSTLVFINQDVTMSSDTCLQNLVENLNDRKDVVGVIARQIARTHLNPLRRYELEQAFPLSSCVQWIKDGMYDSLSGREKRKLANFNTVCSAIRRDYFLTEQFKELEFGEDVEWAGRALKSGHSLAYEASVVVIHSHDFYMSFADTFRLYFDDSAFTETVFGRLASLTWFNFPAAILFVWVRDVMRLRRDTLPVSQKIIWMWRSFPARAAEVLGILAGYNRRFIPQSIAKHMSSVDRKKRS